MCVLIAEWPLTAVIQLYRGYVCPCYRCRLRRIETFSGMRKPHEVLCNHFFPQELRICFARFDRSETVAGVPPERSDPRPFTGADYAIFRRQVQGSLLETSESRFRDYYLAALRSREPCALKATKKSAGAQRPSDYFVAISMRFGLIRSLYIQLVWSRVNPCSLPLDIERRFNVSFQQCW